MPVLTPISALPSSEEIYPVQSPDDVAPLIWELELPPHVDQDRIVVNEGRFLTLQKISHFSTTVVMNYEGNPIEDGKPVKSLVHVLPVDEVANDDTKFSGSGNFGSVLELCKPNIASTVATIVRDQPQVSNEEAWATSLDKAVRDAMRAAAQANLMQRRSLAEKVGALLPAATVSATHPEPLAVGGALIGTAVASMISRVGPGIWARAHADFNIPIRASLVPFAFEPDRYAAACFVSRLPGLVQYLK